MDHVNDWRQPTSEWEDREEFFENILQAQNAKRALKARIAALSAVLIDLGKSQADIIPGGDYAINIIEHAINSSDENIWSDIPEIVARTALLKRAARIPKINQALKRLGYLPMAGSMFISATQATREVLGEELPLIDATLDPVDNSRATFADDGKPIPLSLPVDPVQIHVVSEYLYDQEWTDVPNLSGLSGPEAETIHHGFSPNYADLERASETLGLWTNAPADWVIKNRPLSWIQENRPDLLGALRNTRPEWLRRNKKLVDSGGQLWADAWMNVALGPGRTFTKVGGNRMFRDQLLDLNQAEFLYFPPGGATVGTQFPDAGHEWLREVGPILDPAYGVPFPQFGQVADELQHFQDVAGDVEYTLGMLPPEFGNALDDRWARFREQVQPLPFSPEVIDFSAGDFGHSFGPTHDLTNLLRDAAADAPWAHAPNFGVLAQDAADAASFELWEMEHPELGIRGGAPVPPQAMGGGLAQAANSALRMQDAVGGASFELWELENPLLRTRDGALGLAEAMGGGDGGYGGQGVTGAMDNAGLAADGLALSTDTAGQALLAAGLTGDATTQVLDLMRRAGLDPATAAWDELAVAVQVWGDATDTEVTRVIGRLGELSSAQAGGGAAPGGSSGSGGGGTDDRTQQALDQLLSLAEAVGRARAEMDNLNPQHRAHELAKMPGQLRGPGSLEEQLALLRAFFAGTARGISFGEGPSADRLGFDIPQFAGGGTVPGPLGAPQLIVAHGGEHIVPHRATGSPTIIRIELDREVLAQAVLGDLLRLQGREVTLGLS